VRRTRFLLLCCLLIGTIAPIEPAAATSSTHTTRGTSFRPDGWIKLCGLSLGCRIDPLPHPWRGNDVYNTTGRHQTVSHRIDQGEGIRFWITIENDGTMADTVDVQGCPGNRTFEVNRVLLGKHKRQDPSAVDLTRKYKHGTLTFDLASGAKNVFTLNIITHRRVGVTYRCRTVFTSEGDSTAVDTVVAKMTTF
jgi:hypothetical protein